MKRITLILRRRAGVTVLAVVVLAALAIAGRPAFLWLRAWHDDRPVRETLPPGWVDDASRLERTRIAQAWAIPSEQAVAERELKSLLQRARDEHLAVAIAGARHSMGGQSIQQDGIALDMTPFKAMEVEAGILHVGAGARWSEVIPFLDARGLSVSVMQSNDDFTIGGSLSVNCHGWQHGSPPIASTVESFRLMTADGSIVRCSRTEESELFSLALGGYGLFGVILDADLRVVANECYRADVELLPAADYVARLGTKAVGAPDVGMAYGRLCVVPGERTFLQHSILTCYRRVPGDVPALESTPHARLRREVFRAQIGSQAGKELRWTAETRLGERLSAELVSRNQLLHESADVYGEANADRTDILHESFIPRRSVAEFLEQARTIVPVHGGELLNVTLRDVREDPDTFLRYADEDVLGFVMLFSQERTPEGERAMEAMTRELIDAALACGGRYYLPYRLHATPEQFHRAYPMAREFFDRKRVHDPDEVFRNGFYARYGGARR